MQLIGMLDSPFVRRVAIALRLLDLPYEHRPLSVFRNFQAFSLFNPMVKAPTLVLDDGTVLMDSSLILDYLECLAGRERSLLPQRPQARARALTDIVHTPAVSGVPASFMRQSLEAAGYDLKRLTDKADMNYGEKLKPVNDEAKAWKTVWSAGQGAGNIDDLPGVDELVARLDREYRDALRNMDSLANRWPR